MSRCDISPVPVSVRSTAPRLLRLWVRRVCEWCVFRKLLLDSWMEEWSCFGIKHPYRRHRYVLQNVLIMQAVQLTLYTMGNFSPFVGDTAPTVDRQDKCVCRLTYTAGFNALPVVCELNLTHHLLSLPVLWQYSSCRGTRLILNWGLMTVLWYPGQFSAFGDSLPSFQQWPAAATNAQMWGK